MKINSQNLYNSTCIASKTSSLCGPFLGAPAAAILIETLAASGVTEMILWSMGGGLQTPDESLAIGDIVIPTGALSEEGTSKLYGAETKIPFTSNPFQEKLLAALKQHLPQRKIHNGLIWSTDAPFQETHEKVLHYSKAGALLVDMEFSLFAHLCQLHSLSAAAVFVISDLLSSTWTPGFHLEQFQSSLKEVESCLHQLLFA